MKALGLVAVVKMKLLPDLRSKSVVINQLQAVLMNYIFVIFSTRRTDFRLTDFPRFDSCTAVISFDLMKLIAPTSKLLNTDLNSLFNGLEHFARLTKITSWCER